MVVRDSFQTTILAQGSWEKDCPPDTESFEQLEITVWPMSNFTGSVTFSLGSTNITKIVTFNAEQKIASFIAGKDFDQTLFPATSGGVMDRTAYPNNNLNPMYEWENGVNGSEFLSHVKIANTHATANVVFKIHFCRHLDLR